MMSSVEGRVARRSLTLDLFADITIAPLVTYTPDGVLLDGDLTTDQAIAVWWRMTSTDDTDQACREQIAALVATAEAGTSAEDARFAVLGRYVARLGDA